MGALRALALQNSSAVHSKVSFAPLALVLAACTAVEAGAPERERRARAADGVELAYEEAGAGAPALVFVHGWCGDRELWRSTLEAFAPRQRVLALDLAGHGASGAGRASWTLDALADDVVAVVEASAADEVILVGHSMGATLALLAAPRLAPRVRGVIAVDSLHRADLEYPRGFLEDAARDLELDFSRAVSASFRGVAGSATEPELVDWLAARAARTDRAAAVALLRSLEGFRLGPVLAAAGVPVRVIDAAGRKPEPDVAGLRALCDYDARPLEGVGHFPMLERPAAFKAVLARWIDELARPREAAAR